MRRSTDHRRTARLISWACSRWYGFAELKPTEIKSLAKGLDDISRRLAIDTAVAQFGDGPANVLQQIGDLAASLDKIAKLSTKSALAAMRHLRSGPTLMVGENRVDPYDWLLGAERVNGLALRFAKLARPIVDSGGLEIATYLVGEKLPVLYRATYPGKPFETAKTQTAETIRQAPERWGPGVMFTAIAAAKLAGVRYPDGEAIKAAKRKTRVRKPRK